MPANAPFLQYVFFKHTSRLPIPIDVVQFRGHYLAPAIKVVVPVGGDILEVKAPGPVWDDLRPDQAHICSNCCSAGRATRPGRYCLPRKGKGCHVAHSIAVEGQCVYAGTGNQGIQQRQNKYNLELHTESMLLRLSFL